ncbi:hypothetical protein OKHIL_71330 [Mycolicibacterium mageritense]
MFTGCSAATHETSQQAHSRVAEAGGPYLKMTRTSNFSRLEIKQAMYCYRVGNLSVSSHPKAKRADVTAHPSTSP